MNRPRKAALELLDAYFATAGRLTPAREAEQLISKVQLSEHRWLDRDHANHADEILRRAHYDVDDVAENLLGIWLRIESLRSLDSSAEAELFGLAIPDSREIIICERTLGYEPLYRSTVMHEVAHILLHSKLRARISAYRPFARRKPPEEREADQFMAWALLPDPILLLAIARTADLYSMNVQEAFIGANTRRGRWQWRERYFPFIVNTLCISRHLTGVRLRQLRVFNEDTLKHHLSYSLPTKWGRGSGSTSVGLD